MVVGSFLGGPAGMAIGGGIGMMAGMMLFPADLGSGTGLSSKAAGSRAIVDGFAQTTLSTQVPVPLVFGKALLHGNVLSAILLGGGNSRMVATIGFIAGLQFAYPG